MSGCPYHNKDTDSAIDKTPVTNPPTHHGQDVDQYYIDGESYLVDFNNPDSPCPCIPPALKFCRLLPDLEEKAFRPADADLIELANVMNDSGNAMSDNAQTPAGYTYLGQFIDHDITRDGTVGFPSQDIDPETIDLQRSPQVDLDSLYGGGPSLSPELYDIGGVLFKIGMTTPSGGTPTSNMPFPNDLPREGLMSGSSSPLKALIGDDRNDENLAVAQTHLAFLKFHNQVAMTQNTNFEDTRAIVTQHYQSIVLHDFLPRFVDETVLSDVLNTEPEDLTFDISCGSLPCMPIEFSVAAYRFGHTLIRDEYEWNAVFNSRPGAFAPGTLGLLFDFTGSGGMRNQPSLPSNWIIDWTRFFDFSCIDGVENHPDSNVIRKIDPFVASTLHDLPAFAGRPAEERSLPARNLIRGSRLGLPSGQDLASALSIPILSASDIAQGVDGAVAAAKGFDTQTPLWYYLLKEAQVQQNGERLGALGSRILSEVFVGLVRGTPNNILCEDWKPTLPSCEPDRFTMIDLLAFVDSINPIGPM